MTEICLKYNRFFILSFSIFFILNFSCAKQPVAPDPPKPPIQKYPLDGSKIPEATLAFDWDDIEWASAYHLQVDTTTNFDKSVIDQSAISTSKYTQTNPLPNGKYYWRVCARYYITEFGNWSDIWDFNIISTFTISGSVKDNAGNPISGVTLTFSNDGGTDTTNSNGYYSQSVNHGWSGIVTPSHENYAFSPTNRSYANVTHDLSNQNYEGIPETISTPNTPSGQSSATVGQSLIISTGGSKSNLNHNVEYRFDWGDGNYSNWVDSTLSYVYNNVGTYQIKAQARCKTHTSVVSNWSQAMSISIFGHTLNISINPTGSGSVIKNPNKSQYNHNEIVQLTAVQNTGYQFDHWGGNLSGSSNPSNITMSSDKNVIAFFDTVEIISIPNAPSGSSNGTVGLSYSFSTGGAISNLSHPVEYRFDWGDGNYSSWGSSTQSYIYNNVGTYQIKAQARCQTHTSIVSNWSQSISISISGRTLNITINPIGSGSVIKNPSKTQYNHNENVILTAISSDTTKYRFDHWEGDLVGSSNPATIIMNGNKSVTGVFVNEVISTPNQPSGPSSSTVGQSLSFSTGGSTSSLGHPVEYQFDWGDGNFSSWGSSTQSHSYANTGTFNIKARARCQTHTTIVSNWSSSIVISISDGNEIVSTPNQPSGSSSSSVGQSLSFSTGGSTSNLSHAIEYRFDWGDGDTSNWASANQSHIYPNVGTYQIKAQARCQTHTNILSNWSQSISISISGHTLNIVIYPTGSGSVTTNLYKSQYNHNEIVQLTAVQNTDYQFDHWGGDLSGNSNPVNITMNENKNVTAVFVIPIETVTTPNTPTGPSTTTVGQSLSFSTGGATSNLGDAIEYKFDWGDGNFSNWGSSTQNYSYNNVGTYSVKAQARCQIHTNILSNWSSAMSVTVSGHILSISINPSGSGSVTKSPNKIEYNHNESIQLTASANSGYQFDHWIGDLSGISNPANITMNGNKSVTAVFISKPVTISGYAKDNAGNPISGVTLTFSNNGGSATTNSSGYYSQNVTQGWSGTVTPSYSGYTFSPSNRSYINVSSDQTNQDFTGFPPETISAPNKPSGSSSGTVGQTLSFSTWGSTSNLGHAVEYRFDWGDGNYSAWGSSTQSYTYNNVDTYPIKAQARCQTHTSVVSDWSQSMSISISGHTLNIIINPTGSGSVTKYPNKTQYNHNENVQLTASPSSGYQSYHFDHWEGDLIGNINPTNITMNGNKNVTAVFNSDLVAYYPFNGNANDESGNGNHGTVYGAILTTDRFNNPDKAYYFDGVNDLINCGHKASLQLTNAITISIWFYLDADGFNGRYLIGKSDSASYEYAICWEYFDYPKYGLKAIIGGYNPDENPSESKPDVRRWYHVAVTWEYPGQFKLYLNGETLNIISSTHLIEPTDQDLVIGCIRPSTQEQYRYFCGKIDDIRIYKRALSYSEIQELYHEGGW